MSINHFDKASRFTAHLDPPGLQGWLVTDFDKALRFERWLQTQTTPPPGQPERVPDTIAVLSETARVAPPWLLLIEWQTEPDPDMFGRLLVELGQLWLKHRPDPLPGSRYQLAAAVVNLTGTPTSLPASWEFVLPTPDGTACILRVRERFLSQEDAAVTMGRVERGELGRWILPLMPLMQGAGEDAIIQRWKDLASQELDQRRRSEYGLLAKALAELKDWFPAWERELKEWNMRVSTVFLENKREGAVEALQRTLKRMLEKRFGPLAQTLTDRIAAVTEPDVLDRALDQLDQLTKPDDLVL